MKRKLRAFKIENEFISSKDSGIVTMLNKVLTDESIVSKRVMKLNNQDSDEDLLAFYQWTAGNSTLFGMMMRIIPAEQGEVLSEEMFNKNMIVISDLSQGDNDSSQYKDHYYFAINSNHLVTDLPGNYTIERFQTYVNWLLNPVRGSQIIDFTPIMSTPPEISIKDIRSIEFSGSSTKNTIVIEPQNKANIHIKELKGLILDNILKDTSTLTELQTEQLVSAKLILHIKSKPKGMEENEYNRVMGALTKNMSGDDGLAIKTKNGSIYKGDNIKKVKEVEVETTSKKKIVEEQLKQEMERFLKEL